MDQGEGVRVTIYWHGYWILHLKPLWSRICDHCYMHLCPGTTEVILRSHYLTVCSPVNSTAVCAHIYTTHFFDLYIVMLILSCTIVLNFRGSKFSQIVNFEDFVEIILWICCTCTLHAACQNFSLKYFCEQLKINEICEIKDCINIVLYSMWLLRKVPYEHNFVTTVTVNLIYIRANEQGAVSFTVISSIHSLILASVCYSTQVRQVNRIQVTSISACNQATWS